MNKKAVWEIVRSIAEGGVINWSVMGKTDEAKVRPRKPHKSLDFKKIFWSKRILQFEAAYTQLKQNLHFNENASWMKICLTGIERDTRWPKTATNSDCFCSGLTLVSKNVNTRVRCLHQQWSVSGLVMKLNCKAGLCAGHEQMSWTAFAKVEPAVISEHLAFLRLDIFSKGAV